MSKMLTMTPAVDAAIRAHGRQIYPYECCGALIGRDADAVEVYALPNTTEEGPRRRFLVRPADYRLAEQHADERGLTLLGFYHSHPDHPARPSQYDVDHAWPSFAYLILSVREGQDRELTCWYLRDDRSGLEEAPVRLEEVPASELDTSVT
jgi:proteasome lid subunit RPN8/RPN11